MRSFDDIHAEVRNTIDGIGSFEETIENINQINKLIVPALVHRSRFPICRQYFMSMPQRELKALGIDSWAWQSEHLPILEMICSEGEVSPEQIRDMLFDESWLERLIHERILIGEKVVEYKAPRGLEITRKDREEGIVKEMRDLGRSYGLNPDAVENVFRRVIQRNKDLQNCLIQGRHYGIGFEVIEQATTMQDDAYVDNMKKAFRRRIQELEDKDAGRRYYVLVEEKCSIGYPLERCIKLVGEKVA